MITRENYELFYMDYLEGDLDSAFAQELEAFLEKNPDLLVDGDFLDPIPNDEFVYPHKSELKFEVIPDFTLMSKEDKIIAYHEGILTTEQEQEVDVLLNNSEELRASFNAFKLVYLKKDQSIYANKGQLKKKNTLILWPLITAAAASFALLFFLNTEIQQKDTQFANHINIKKGTLTDPLNGKTGSKETKISVDLSKNEFERKVKKLETKVKPSRTHKSESTKRNDTKIDHLSLRTIALNTKQEKHELKTTQKYQVEASESEQLPVAKTVTLKNVLPPVINYAVAEVTDSKVQIKKESDKKLNEGAKYFIKFGPIEIAKK